MRQEGAACRSLVLSRYTNCYAYSEIDQAALGDARMTSRRGRTEALMKPHESIGVVLTLSGLLSACHVRKIDESPMGVEPELRSEPRATSRDNPAARAPGDEPDGFRGVFVRVARSAVPSVVSVVSERNITVPRMPFDFFGGGNPFEFFFEGPGAPGMPRAPERQFRQSGLGSGFLLDERGHILTNNHVVEKASSLKVKLSDDREIDAEVVGADAPTDLAVIKLKEKPPPGLLPARFGNSDKLQIGEWVVAVGAPFGLYESVTTGIISAMGRQNTGITAFGNFLQTDAAINPGNSGGPLVNLDGEVVGINTAIFSQSGGYQGVGFAIPVNLAKVISKHLIEEGKVTRGYIGVSIQSISPDMAAALGLSERAGALVGDVVPGGPAQKAGMRRGDVILAVAGEPVRDANDLMNRIAMLAPGTSAEVSVARDGKKTNVKVTVAKREEESEGVGRRPEPTPDQGAEATALGLGVTELTTSVRQHLRVDESVRAGVVVAEVDPSGAAADAGLRPGDVIVEINRKPVTSPRDFQRQLRKAPKGKNMLLLVHRGGNTFFVAVTPRR